MARVLGKSSKGVNFKEGFIRSSQTTKNLETEKNKVLADSSRPTNPGLYREVKPPEATT